MKSIVWASSKSAALLRYRARVTGAVACHSNANCCAKCKAFCTSWALASMKSPTTSDWSAGLITGRLSPTLISPANSDVAANFFCADCAKWAAISCSVISFEKSRPAEFLRSLPNKSAGKAIPAWGLPPSSRDTAIGSAINVSIDTFSSTIWLTKEELAPFSNNRLTR